MSQIIRISKPTLEREDHKTLFGKMPLSGCRLNSREDQVANKLFQTIRTRNLEGVNSAISTLKMIQVKEGDFQRIIRKALSLAVKNKNEEAIIRLLHEPSVRHDSFLLADLYNKCSSETAKRFPKDLQKSLERPGMIPMGITFGALGGFGVGMLLIKIAAIAALAVFWKVAIVLALIILFAYIGYKIVDKLLPQSDRVEVYNFSFPSKSWSQDG